MMTERKWTPGPLVYQDDHLKPKYGVIQNADGKSVADMRFKAGKEYVSLFAAAPDLYEALEEAADPINGYLHGPALERARAALAKARGES